MIKKNLYLHAENREREEGRFVPSVPSLPVPCVVRKQRKRRWRGFIF